MNRKPASRIAFKIRFWGIAAACLIFVTSLVGCFGDPNLADVKGVVLLDGKPLPDAFITFTPESDSVGATSFGKTAADGSYRLKFSDTQNGAWIGSNRVSIGTGDIAPDNSGRTPEVVPNAYNTKTKLTADVKSGNNTFDFDLKSDVSKIEQVDVDDG